MNDPILTPDLCVIGGGVAGVAVAAGAATAGVPVVLVERAALGGPRLHGEVASHALIAAARRVRAIRDAASFGIQTADAEIDFDLVRKEAQNLIADLARNESEARLAALGVSVIKAEAEFADRATVVAGGREIRARRFVLAVGSVPVVPEIAGLAEAGFLTADAILDLRECPRQLIVIGAGSTGLALGQAFRRLGAEVTVLDAATPLRDEDPECADLLLDALAREGMAVRSGVEIERVERGRDSLRVAFSADGRKETAEGTHLLLAAGRRLQLEGLGLEAAGVERDAGGIRFGPDLRTSNRKVFVIGDAAGGPRSVHAARWQARRVLANVLFRVPVRAWAGHIPRATYTNPELAHVGLREDEARRRHRRIRIVRWLYFENDRAALERAVPGVIKLVTTRGGRIVGVTIVGPRASEQAALYVLALAKRLTIRELAGLAAPYPTFAEIGPQAAAGELARGLTNPWVRRIIRAIRLFG